MSGSDPGKGGMPAMSPAVVVVALALLMGIQPITTDLYLPALPLLARDLHAPMAGVQLTMSVLLLAFGFGQLTMGPVSDRFGRRPVLLGGLGLYTLASVLATLAPDITVLIAMRAVQGVGMAASVVCARAMVRDLYEPHQGAHVMSRGLSGLGVIAMLAPTVGGLVAGWAGWRAALGVVSASGAAMGLFIALKVPETARSLNPHALALGPLLANFRTVLGNATFRAWATLVTFTYAGLFVLLAGSSFVYTGPLGVPPWGYGLAMASASVSYLVGTFLCRRWLPRLGLAGTVRIGGAFTLAGGSLMLVLGLADVRHVAPVLLAHWLYSFGHGIHQPCGQSGAVGPFPRMAGTASALAGFMLSLTAFGVGLWMGQAMDGSLKMLSIGVFTAAVATTAVAWTLVQRDGEHLAPRPA
ncbi:MAG: Bcr/CflA family efflux MFS transporter [Vitreoscilla sp.]|nr:Bcr/CflA family efflux MFS transporter [Burkholderiales bacterium]MBP6336708.1 Bcr/CflA family efflux MFS transporter [Vitreoscilla sp.]